MARSSALVTDDLLAQLADMTTVYHAVDRRHPKASSRPACWFDNEDHPGGIGVVPVLDRATGSADPRRRRMIQRVFAASADWLVPLAGWSRTNSGGGDWISRRASPVMRRASRAFEQPVPEPAQQHLQPIAEADEERDVDAAPQTARRGSRRT